LALIGLKDIVKSDNLPDCSFEWHAMACFIFIYYSFFVFLPFTAVQERDGQIHRVGETQK